jgi:uncharacterized damage-inducible protein DinB
LLTTIRLERINELDALCEKALAQTTKLQPKEDDKGHEEMTAEITKQIQGTIIKALEGFQVGMTQQLKEWQMSITQEIEARVSNLVKQETLRVLEQAKEEMDKKIQQVQRKLDETETAPPTDKASGNGLYSYLPWHLDD